jgi:hypothetical protein
MYNIVLIFKPCILFLINFSSLYVVLSATCFDNTFLLSFVCISEANIKPICIVYMYNQFHMFVTNFTLFETYVSWFASRN